MHGTAPGAIGWLDSTALAQAMRGWLWLYPSVEIVHIIGFVILVGAAAMFDLRLLGFSRQIPVQALGRHLLPWSAGALLLIVPAGLMMFTAHPQEWIGNRIFVLKLCLIGAAGMNAAMFHVGVYRSVADWNTGVAAPAAAKAHAVVSLLLWGAVISCGRLLAYT